MTPNRRQDASVFRSASFPPLSFLPHIHTLQMPSHPATYKAAFVTEVGKPLEIRDVDWPKNLAEGHVVVKVLASGLCHSDSLLQQGHMGTLPRVPGHEIIGEIVQLHESVKSWKVGQRVGSGWHGGALY